MLKVPNGALMALLALLAILANLAIAAQSRSSDQAAVEARWKSDVEQRLVRVEAKLDELLQHEGWERRVRALGSRSAAPARRPPRAARAPLLSGRERM